MKERKKLDDDQHFLILNKNAQNPNKDDNFIHINTHTHKF